MPEPAAKFVFVDSKGKEDEEAFYDELLKLSPEDEKAAILDAYHRARARGLDDWTARLLYGLPLL
jgi:hypothetical protein